MKDYITIGSRHLQRTGPDVQAWSRRMMDAFGPEIAPKLGEIREWSIVLHSRLRGPITKRKNCWEVMGCGREAGGRRVNGKGACPASTESSLHAIHGGINAGRACWTVEGTLCRSSGPDTLEAKRVSCSSCTFYRSFLQEEHPHLILSDEMLRSLLP
jgi:hypothetical protein